MSWRRWRVRKGSEMSTYDSADLEVLGAIDEAEQGSVTKEAEEAAAALLKDVERNEHRQSGATEGAGADLSAIHEIETEIERLVGERDYAQAAALEVLRKSLCDALPAERPVTARS